MSFERFFHPRSIAVVGVSRSPRKLGSRIFRNLRAGGFRGTLIPVNPKLRSFDGIRAVPSVDRLAKPADLAIVVTPAETVPDIVEACGRKRIRNVVVISAGFREVGGEGRAREERLKQSAAHHRIRLLGPNCLGFLHGDFRMNASFAQPLPPGGSIVILSQSGAMAVAMSDWARSARVGIRALVSLGNSAGIGEAELIRHFGRDPKTHAILLYLENLERGGALLAAARSVSRSKPIIALTAGESEQGMRAASSHTGALASERAVVAAALASVGVVRVDRIENLFDMAMLVASVRTLAGNRVAIVTNAGGPGIMATDALAATNLTLAAVSSRTREQLTKALPEAASTSNPIDLVGDADARRYERALTLLARDPNVDALLTILTPQVVTEPLETARVIARIQRRFRSTPIVAAFLGGSSVAPAQKLLAASGVPQFLFPEDAVAALDRLWWHAEHSRGPRASIPAARPARPLRPSASDRVLLPSQAHAVLRRAGFSIVKERFIPDNRLSERPSDHSLRRMYRALHAPVVLKLMSHRVIHKARRKAVWLNLSSPQELRTAWHAARRTFPSRTRRWPDEGWLVQTQREGYEEWFLGGKRDPSFGVVLLFGQGGTEVERHRNVVTIVPPVTASSCREAWSLLPSRFRETLPGAVIAALQRLERLLASHPEISEVDCNPFLVHPRSNKGIVVDARFVLARS